MPAMQVLDSTGGDMADEEHVALARQGVGAINAFAEGHPDVTLDLSEADLAGAALRGLRVNGANLAGADLERADLSRALLNGANLAGANLRCADLSGASFHRADLAGADLRDVTFEAAYPPRLCIHESSFEGVRWSRDRVEDFLRMLNRNRDWEIKYEIVAKQPEDR
jgi:uncharacterized protein YjbI with pentapeptide repeats